MVTHVAKINVWILNKLCIQKGFSGVSISKESTYNAGAAGVVGQEDPYEKKNGNPFQYSCLGNPTDREAWQAIAHGVTDESDMTW